MVPVKPREQGRRSSRLAALLAWLQGRSDPLSCQLRSLVALGDGCLARSHFTPGHFTASAWIMCPERRRLVLIFHRKLGRWLQPGGHIEVTDGSLGEAAAREACEETGLTALQPLGSQPFDCDVHDIPATRDEPQHQHFDLRFAFRATGAMPLPLSPDPQEVTGARWVPFEDVAQYSTEDSVLQSAQRLSELASLRHN